jgi:general secretion pathway protein J
MRRIRAHGFTLLEMTVVLLLVAMMSTVIVEGLRFGGRAYAQVVRVDEANWSVFVAQRFLRVALESAYPFEPERAGGAAYGLEGSTTRLSFSAPALRAAGSGGLNRYDVFVAADSKDTHRMNLLVSWRVDRDGRPNDAGPSRNQEVLLENISRIEWSYVAASCSGLEAWQEGWQGHRELPALVRARVVFPKDDPRRWPDLIVVPRITDDAISWFYRPNAADQGCGSSP